MISRNPMFLGAAAAVLAALPAQAAVNISSAPTKNVVCSAGTCSPTAKGAILNVTDLENLLATSDVTVNTGSGAVTIEVTAPLSWASTHRLTLNANFNVSVKAVVAVEGTSGLTVNYSNGGDFLFFPGGKIDFWDTNSSLIVNGASYVLVNDVATLAGDVASNPSGLYAFAKDYDAGPDGTYENGITNTGFGGLLEGLGHTVSNLAINGSAANAVGMFQQTSSGVVIRDLSLENVNIQAQAQNTGVGAFVGQGATNFVNVSSSGTISGGTDTGGLIGHLITNGNVTRSHSSASVSNQSRFTVGGLVGYAEGNIFNSYDIGRVSGAKSAVGGLAGGLHGQIVQSFSNADVTSHGSVTIGGLVGGISNEASISDSYAMGQVTAGHFSTMGGLIGFDAGSVSRSYSTTAVVYRSHAPQKTRIGGFAGRYAGGTLDSDYWDVDTSLQQQPCANPCHAVTGLSDAALKSGLPSGFDPAIWAQSASVNNGYPYLIATPPQ